MEKDYIRLYLDNVVSRLPQKDRDEVRKELNANIRDMLSENPGDAEIKSLLEGLGSPAVLAEKYRTKPRYLISPAVFDNYISVLKIGVPIIALVSAFAGFLAALIGVIDSNITEISHIISEVVGAFISSIFTGAFYAAVIITAGFAIYEHTSNKTQKIKPQVWSAEQLKETGLNSGGDSLSVVGSGVSILITVCLSIFFILLALNILPDSIWIRYENLEVYSFFSKQFLRRVLYIIPLLALSSILTDILKIKERRWTKSVLYSAIGVSLIYMASFIYLFASPNMLSAEFISFLHSLPVDSPKIIDMLVNGKLIAAVTISIAVIIGLINIGQSLYKLMKMNKN